MKANDTGPMCFCGHREGRHWGADGRCVDCQCHRFEEQRSCPPDWWERVIGWRPKR